MNGSLLRRILVPLDGSPYAETVFPLLRRFLTAGASLTLVQAVPFFDDEGAVNAGDYLLRWARRLTNEGFPATPLVRWGSAADVIRDVSRETQSTLVALATHGRTGIDRWAMGSVAEEVLQTSLVPVLLARAFAPAGAATPLRNILLPLDNDPRDLDALEPMADLAHGRDVRVRLLEVAEPADQPGHWETPGPSARIVDQILRAGCIPTTYEQRRGKPSEEILKSAVEHQVDLIAMTTHGRHGPPRLFMGSVTAEVLRHTPVPLLAVRHAAKKSAAPVEIPATSSATPSSPGAGMAFAPSPP